MGSIKAESLPNIKGTFYGRQNGLTGGSGAFYDGNNPYGGMGSGSNNNQMNFNASRSSSTYQDNAPVQQEAIQYPYFIQVATGVEESVDVTREIELNNPYSLFDAKFVDHTLNNSSWLLSNGNWASGTVYVSAYEELLSEYNLGTEQTDGNITYKLTPKGYRIADVAEDTDVSALYASQGVAWYYVLDTANTQFKLPQSKWGFVGCRNNVGNYVLETLPNITGSAYNNDGNAITSYYPKKTGSFYGIKNLGAIGWYSKPANNNSDSVNFSLGFDASLSSSTYQNGAPVQQRATEMYLYFYVGETAQDANLINAGRALEQLANKANVDMDNLSAAGRNTLLSGVASSARVISVSLAPQAYFQAPANGYIEIRINGTDVYGQALIYAEGDENRTTPIFNSGIPKTVANAARGMFYIGKGQIFVYNSTVTADAVIFRYALGEK